MKSSKHYTVIRKFWGTNNSADNQAEMYAGLGQLYISDDRYIRINGSPQPDLAQFMQKAMNHFANSQLK